MLTSLEKSGLIERREQNTAGRPAEVWFAVETAKEAKEAKEVQSSPEGVRTGSASERQGYVGVLEQ